MNKKIVVGVTGGIAAYKTVELIRLLREQGDEVRVVMTENATKFVTPLTFQAISEHSVVTDLFDESENNAMAHINLARFADAIVIAPASANAIAKLAFGMADNVLTTLCLASKAPIIIAPAMNRQMWMHPAVQQNINTLRERTVKICGPAEGKQACGDVGLGRMVEPEQLLMNINELFSTSALSHKKILITAGPTQESIDPVRYITNHSSGKMGYAIAEAAMEMGADVTLISGPTSLQCSSTIKRIDVVTALEMYKSVIQHIEGQDIFICVAAVADYHFATPASQKLKKTTDQFSLVLKPTPDILTHVATLMKPPLTVGFAAETENVVENAKTKLMNKGLDMIIANQVGGKEIGFHSDENSAIVMTKTGDYVELPIMNKSQLARQLIQLIAKQLKEITTSRQKKSSLTSR